MIRLIKYPHYCTDTIVLAVIFGLLCIGIEV